MPLTTKQIVDAHCHQMHPDLFEPSDETKFILKMWDDQDQIRAKQDFWIDALQAGLPSPLDTWTTTWFSSVAITQRNELYQIDEKATVKLFAKIVKWARSKGYSIEKKYDYDFRVCVGNIPGIKDTMDFTAEREVMCKKVFVGTKVIPYQPPQSEKVVDNYDWECEKLSFLGIED